MSGSKPYQLSVYPGGTRIIDGLPINNSALRLDVELNSDAAPKVRLLGSEKPIAPALESAILQVRTAIARARTTDSRSVIEIMLSESPAYPGFSKGKAYVSVNS